MAIFRISGVWHDGWWKLITSVRLIQVGNNRNDHFRYFLGVRVRLIKVSFNVNKGNKFWDFGYCPLNRGRPVRLIRCTLNTGSLYTTSLLSRLFFYHTFLFYFFRKQRVQHPLYTQFSVYTHQHKVKASRTKLRNFSGRLEKLS